MTIMSYIQTQGVYFVRIILACICGGIIGIERQQRTKVAGTRTHMMIGLATALMMIISKYGFMDIAEIPGASLDVSRVAAGIISGIGILGGGIIFTGKQGYVSGITTAVGIWATIGVGMAFGAGMYVLGIGTTLIMVILQWALHKNLWIVKQPVKAQVSFRLDNDRQAYEKYPTSWNGTKYPCTSLNGRERVTIRFCSAVRWLSLRVSAGTIL